MTDGLRWKDLNTLEKRFAGALFGAVLGDAAVRYGMERGAFLPADPLPDAALEPWPGSSPLSDEILNLVRRLARHGEETDAGDRKVPATSPMTFVIPLGLWLHEDVESAPEAVEDLFRSEGIDDQHLAGATAVAQAVGYVVPRESVAASDLIDVLSRGVLAQDPILMERLDGILELLSDTAEASPGDWTSMGEGDAATILRPALYAFLRRNADFRRAVGLMASWGGDLSVPRAVLAGALCGAFRGMSGLPAAMVSSYPGGEDLLALSRELYRASMRD